ncbi:MAG: hypothetical protein ABS97_20155 [Lysobacteraceae bacterium SCN 69-320]|nr:MAG: hypothetical protein ABS97_20155 [Xanthomonadaceae bacterium SCN 69-320]
MTSSESPAPAETGAPLYAGDCGNLPMDTRQALCKLLSGPYLEVDSPHWPALLRDEGTIRARLADLFLELVIDRERKVAFSRQADTGELDTPILQRTSTLSFLDSVMVLNLRQRLVDADGLDQRAVVEQDALLEDMEVFASAGDAVATRKRIGASIEKLKKANLLQPIRGTEGRYEIAPVLRLPFTAEDVQALSARYRALAAGESVADAEEEDEHG